MLTLSERLLAARKERGWTKAELRRHAGLKSSSTLTEIEQGSITESPQLLKIALALGVEAMWLQYGKGPRYKGKQLEPEITDTAKQIAIEVSKATPAFQNAVLQMILASNVEYTGKDTENG